MGEGTLDILIIDDDIVIGETITDFCRQKNITATHTTKVRDALALVKLSHPKIIMIDIFMPDMDGFDLANIINTYHPGAHIVLMSGLYDIDQNNLKKIGFAEFMKKPLDMALFETLLKKYQLPS